MRDPFPLYNITVKKHPSYGSTVTQQTLRKLKLRVPKTPDLKEEEERIERRQKEGHERNEVKAEIVSGK